MSVFFQFALTVCIASAAAVMAFTFMRRSSWARKRRSLPEGLSRKTADRIFLMFSIGYVLVFGTLSVLRHLSFHSGGYDLGIFDQVVWNSLNGRLFENSLMIDSPSFLGHHLSPLLLGLVPFYALWSDPIILLITQTLALTASAFPLYWFARKQIGCALALAIGAVYFLSPSLQSVNLFEFHEIALATPLLALALFFLLENSTRPFLVCLFLSFLAKEEVAFIAVAFGGYIFAMQKRWGLGLSLIGLGLVWAVATIFYIIPSFRPVGYGSTYYFVERYLYLGDTVQEVAQNAIAQPFLVIEHLLVPTKIEFVLHLLVPLVFIPLAGIEVFAMAGPTLGYLLIGDNAFQNSIRFQYTAPLLPFVFFASVVGLKRLLGWNVLQRWIDVGLLRATLVSLLAMAGMVNYFFHSAGPLGGHFDPSQYRLTNHTALGYELLKEIPPGASVMVESNFAPHLSQRLFAYQTSVVPNLRKIDYLLADKTLPIHHEYEIIWRDILPSPMFVSLTEEDGYIFKKHADLRVTTPLEIQFDQRITLLGYTPEFTQPVRSGETITVVLLWRADQPIRERYIIFMHVLDAQGRIWTQGDREPANGWFRTDRWDAGDMTNDRYWLELPEEIPPGKFKIIVGLYNVANQARLTTREGVDYADLTTLEVQ